jgi:hypothetical protein
MPPTNRDKRLFLIGILAMALGLTMFMTIHGIGLTPAQRELLRKIDGPGSW